MKKLSLFAAALLLLSVMGNATIRRVGFFGTPVTGVDYTSLQLANNAAAAGDTIMMMPGSDVTANVSKPLVVIGPGFLLDPNNTNYPGNAGLQANINSTSGGSLTFIAGSSNAQVLGCSMSSIIISAAGLSNILIKRCFLVSSASNVNFNTSCSGFTFQQCVFLGYPLANNSNITVSNLSFLNCLFNSYGPQFYDATVSSSGLINNCVLLSSVALGSGAWQVQNCISQSSFSGTNVVYNNNVGTTTQFPTGNGNQQNKAWATIFNLTGSYDGKYSLKSGSPAIGGGVGGIDAGIFGGTAPYHLSGIPSVPTIYAISSPQGTTPVGNSVQINLSTRSNN